MKGLPLFHLFGLKHKLNIFINLFDDHFILYSLSQSKSFVILIQYVNFRFASIYKSYIVIYDALLSQLIVSLDLWFLFWKLRLREVWIKSRLNWGRWYVTHIPIQSTGRTNLSSIHHWLFNIMAWKILWEHSSFVILLKFLINFA